MPEKNINHEFRLEKIEIRNNLIKDINQNELVSKKHKKVCRVLNYIDHLFMFCNRIKNLYNNCRN